jgi:HNH endonuclease/AP2 domain
MKNDFKIMGKTVIIYVNYGGRRRSVFIDKEDLPVMKSFDGAWFLLRDNTVKSREKFYVAHTKSGSKTVLLHRLLMNPGAGLIVDHIDGNPLNNRRKNLRLLTHAENMQNRSGLETRNKSGYRGISWDKRRNKWRAKVKLNGKVVYEKFFSDIKEANHNVIEARKIHMPYANN